MRVRLGPWGIREGTTIRPRKKEMYEIRRLRGSHATVGLAHLGRDLPHPGALKVGSYHEIGIQTLPVSKFIRDTPVIAYCNANRDVLSHIFHKPFFG